MEIDLDTLRPALGGVTGGLSGPAVRPVALRCVWQVHQAVPHLPLLGMGGIMTGQDALRFLLAGASAVSVGTAVFHDPTAPIRILRELEAELDARGFASVADAIGFAHKSAGAAGGAAGRRQPVGAGMSAAAGRSAAVGQLRRSG